MPAYSLLKRIAFRCLMGIYFVGIGGAVSHAKPTRENEGRAAIAAGHATFALGDFEGAIARWQKAEVHFKQVKDVEGELDALLLQSKACRELGQSKLALETLDSAELLDREFAHRVHTAEIKAARAAVCMFGRDANRAEPLLRDSLRIAREKKDRDLEAAVLNDLGILLVAGGKAGEGIAAYDEAIGLARGAGNQMLAAKARKNMADAALEAKEYAKAERWARQVSEEVGGFPACHDGAFLLIGAAQILKRLFFDSDAHDNALRSEAFALLREAQRVGEEIGDDRAISYSLGYQGALYELEKRYTDALTLTRRAVFVAQRGRSVDALYRWQWQSGRLLARCGEHDAAIHAYRRAVGTLQGIRNDVAIRHGNRNARSSFREAVGAVYFELADLLLQRADAAKEFEEIQSLLREARDTAELFKAAEIEDYFQDDCVNLLKSKTRKVEVISPTAAVIYVVPLPTRTELLVSLPSGRLERFKASIPDEALTDVIRRFRLHLEDRTSDAYIEEARSLYSWLITPLEPVLARSGIDTMVFVPDGAMRTIPMAALHDGQKFLIEKYAIVVSPGLELMEAKPVAQTPARIMISGLSEAVEGFAPLVHVPRELENIAELYHRHDALMNGSFRHDAVRRKLAAEEFTIVHIASHGHFDSDVRKSFVLTFDKHLTLDDLETFIRPGQLRDNPLELLTLSACQTAAGDDRAALGLAGIAVKAGARSALATLWFVNDQASTQVVSDFYTQLKRHPTLSKAAALQRAQNQLLSESRYQHPCYWAPYLIIGNWL